ncbi:hypothetical protein KC325_g167 [Hortaea werneckii]|nr:hypothetical protein KC325_g167 [Hortaea werneckii]
MHSSVTALCPAVSATVTGGLPILTSPFESPDTMSPLGKILTCQTKAVLGAPGRPTRIMLSAKPATTTSGFWSSSAVDKRTSAPSPQPATISCDLASSSFFCAFHRGCDAKHQTSLKLPVDRLFTMPGGQRSCVACIAGPRKCERADRRRRIWDETGPMNVHGVRSPGHPNCDSWILVRLEQLLVAFKISSLNARKVSTAAAGRPMSGNLDSRVRHSACRYPTRSLPSTACKQPQRSLRKWRQRTSLNTITRKKNTIADNLPDRHHRICRGTLNWPGAFTVDEMTGEISSSAR